MSGGGWEPFRLEPRLPVQAYKTYQVARPAGTHDRRATCTEVDCAARLRGWLTEVDVSTPLGGRQANYIRLQSGRRFTHTQAGDLVSFTFPAGQDCFAEHRVGLDRPALFIVKGGDWRQQTAPSVRMRAEDWVDDFATHQQQIADHRRHG